MQLLKVSAKSKSSSVAGAMAIILKNERSVELIAIGAGAVNQAVKSIAIARGFLAPSGKNLVCIPAFMDTEIDNVEKSAIKFIVSVE